MSKHTPRIAHLTSVHPRYDTRIFIKMCSSLALKSYDVNLVVADGKGAEQKNDVCIHDVGATRGGRILRVIKTGSSIYKKAKEIDADIYHLHDPELIPLGLILKRMGKKVIFDAHEDITQQIIGKPYLYSPVQLFLSKILGWFEQIFCPKFDAIVAATPHIMCKFKLINPNTLDINNYPLVAELANKSSWKEKKNEVTYVGGIAKIRGIIEMVSAMEFTNNVRLNLVGNFNETKVKVFVKDLNTWSKINYLGFLNRQEISRVLANSKAGLVTFLASPNHINAQPNKMFEYMSAGLPIITSNFPLWRKIVEGNKCGICVDPAQPKQIGDAIMRLLQNDCIAKEMGRNGRQAVLNIYNWEKEVEKLYNLYITLF